MKLQKGIPSVESLTLEQKVGQVLCLGWQADSSGAASSLNSHARTLIKDLYAGVVVLLGRNISNPDATRDLLCDLQSLSTIPLLIAVDQEGGSVNRIGPPIHQFPGNMALGAVAYGSGIEKAEELARKQAEAQARELRSLGINWNLAPVLDVNSNPDNPIIGIRSYGEDPELVARLGCAAISGYQDAGIMACAKHFPGHGDTSVDSHLALPSITGARDRLDCVELVPFKAAIGADVSSIMTTHILFKALDPDKPATLSKSVLTGLLRNEMEYDGLIVTDCLEMNAVAKTVGTARAAVEALKAGADVALVCHTLETQVETRDAILNAVKSGELPEERVDEAVERVLNAKRRYFRFGKGQNDAVWLDRGHDRMEDDIAQRSVSVVKTNGLIPLTVQEESVVLVLSAHFACERLVEIMKAFHRNTWAMHLGSEYRTSDVNNTMRIAYEYARLGGFGVVLTAPREPWADRPIDQEAQARLAQGLHAIYGDRLIAVALREPYDIRRFPQIENYICTYGYNDCSLRALANVLLGRVQSTGRLPVSIPGIYELPRNTA